jgi:hypothetical protein
MTDLCVVDLMSALRGPHHFLAAGSSVAEMIFRFLQSRCQAGGGTLSAADLESAHTQFLNSLPNAFSFFDTVHQRCMEASAATAPELLGQDAILGSLLLACSQKAARTAFDLQVTRFGDVWLNQCFGGVAQYVRQHICPTADERLYKVYARVAMKVGAKLTIADLVKDDAARAILRECLAPLITADAQDALGAPLSDTVSLHIATVRGIPKPDISKVTEQQMRSFLAWLPPQVMLTLSGAGSTPSIVS